MTDTRLVYDKDGNAHEMSLLNARDMVQNCGWSYQKPIVKVVPAAEVVEPEPNPIAPLIPPIEPDPLTIVPVAKPIEEMSKNELVEYAETKFAVKLDARKSLQNLYSEVQKLEEGLV